MKLASFLSLSSLLAISVFAHADTTYTSASAFAAATTGITTVTFDGIAPAGGFVDEGHSFNIGGAAFSSSNFINLNDAAYYPDTYPGSGQATYNSGGYLLPTEGTTDILTISFALSPPPFQSTRVACSAPLPS